MDKYNQLMFDQQRFENLVLSTVRTFKNEKKSIATTTLGQVTDLEDVV